MNTTRRRFPALIANQRLLAKSVDDEGNAELSARQQYVDAALNGGARALHRQACPRDVDYIVKVILLLSSTNTRPSLDAGASLAR